MFGPLGTAGSAGAGPRPAGTSWHMRLAPSFSQSEASPLVLFSLSEPVTNLDLPVAVSATQSSIPFSLVLVNERCLPFGEKLTSPRFAFGGTVTLISDPSAIDLRVIPVR